MDSYGPEMPTVKHIGPATLEHKSHGSSLLPGTEVKLEQPPHWNLGLAGTTSELRFSRNNLHERIKVQWEHWLSWPTRLDHDAPRCTMLQHV